MYIMGYGIGKVGFDNDDHYRSVPVKFQGNESRLTEE